MSRFLHLAFRVLVVLAGIVIVLGLLLVWRLNQSPVTLTRLTPYIISGIESFIPGSHTEIAHTLLTWNNQDHTVNLHADDVRIHDASGAVIAETPSLDVELNLFGVMFGQFLPTALTVDRPQIKLERNAQGAFMFGGMQTSNTTSGHARDSLAHVSHNFVHAVITHRLNIEDAAIDIHDATTGSTWNIHIPHITLQRVFGELTGEFEIEVHQKDRVSTLDLHYTYDRFQGLHNFSTHFADITPSFFAGGHPETIGLQEAAIVDLPLSGEATAALDDNLDLESGALQLHGGEGRLIYANFWNAPRAVKNLDVTADYNRKKKLLNIPTAFIDFGGPKLSLAVTGYPPARADHDLDFDMTAKLDAWPMDAFDGLWPLPVIPNPRSWIAEHLSKGTFDHGEAAFKGTLKWSDLGNIDMTEGKGKIAASGARVDYLDGMPPVDGVSAIADFDLTQLTARISEGGIGNIKIIPFTLQITGLDTDIQNIDIPLKITAPVPEVLRLIDSPRLNYAKSVGLSPDDFAGRIGAMVDLRFPLFKDLAMKDVGVEAKADIHSLASSKLMKGVDISDGEFAMTLDKQGFKLEGPVSLNKVPLHIVWQQNFHESDDKPLKDAKITGTIDGEQWKTLGVDALSGLHGPIPVFFQLTEPKANKALYFGTLNMDAAEIHVDQLNWKKPSGSAATLKFTAEKSAGKKTEIKSIIVTGGSPDAPLNVKGNAVLSADGTRLLSLNLDPFVLGRTNVALHFSQDNEENGALHFQAEGPSLDLSGLRGGKDPAHTAPRSKEYRIKVGKLYTSDTGFMTSVQGYALRDGKGWNAINLRGLADGSQQLNVDLKSENGGRVFAITCDDFGKALKGMGFTDTVRDSGKLSIRGKSAADDPTMIEGEAKIGHFTVHNLPVLALLLNATSPFGFSGILTDSADFSDMGGKFRWQGDTIELKDVRAAGAAVGLNIDGKVDMDSGDANLKGTIVPFSMINRVLNNIPLVGDLITGGEGGGVLAVAYTITGSLDDPKINVNPVSLLTPGFLRNLFFGDDNDGSDSNSDADEAQEGKL